MRRIPVLNIGIDNLSTSELLHKLDLYGGLIFTPNVDHLVKLQNDKEFYEIYQQADYKVCDSKILIYLAKFLGTPLQEKISGSDLFPAYYNYNRANEKVKIFLLGAAEGVAKKAQQKINKKVGRQIIIGSYSPPYGFEKDEAECQKIIDLVNESGATALAMGVGSPKQEKWLAKNRDKLKNIKVLMGIGATIDFEAGNVPRAPKWMSEVGLEWFYRLSCEPKRLWKRYMQDDLPIFWLVFLQKFGFYRNPFAQQLEHKPKQVYSHKPIGQVLQKAGLISDEQIKYVLKTQAKQRHFRFGDLLVMRGWIKPETVNFFVEHLPKLATAQNPQPIGQYLKAAGLLEEWQISTILKEQRQHNLRFGEVAVMKGWVKQETIDFFLHHLGGGNLSVATEMAGTMSSNPSMRHSYAASSWIK
ncbi:WecB/TagA/CpsF family glycosyltransferase [Ancylothrix sp. C2]|uniref:WecB/TagA/CpsF family glycosyltransferase n=1 Tax=Ancylothrix sp. D3o TaxID=2953691 RepID=UPI0021BA69CF|nr:WecB/TagA/CpsF family glycosyltransferase [Ancylothrix sp. D3o]MCT7949708.1 WecB/TagA/CpsF family glycosyltransferase [Ancylothrix sp. D3o]